MNLCYGSPIEVMIIYEKNIEFSLFQGSRVGSIFWQNVNYI